MAKREGPEADEAGTPRSRLIPPRGGTFTRRRVLLGAGAAVIGVGGFEYASFRGTWDHRRLSVDGRSRFDESMQTLDTAKAEGKGSGWNSLVHIGHSTHLIVVDGVRFLTDPWFYDPAFGAMRHEVGPAIDPKSIASLDCILITHDHADHCDEHALRELHPKGVVCVVGTTALADKVTKCGLEDVRVLEPWRSLEVRGVEVAAVPGLHDIYEIGFVVRGKQQSCYFAGDSALHPDLAAIAERFAPTLSILPVDGTRLRGGDLHVMRPPDAVEAGRILKSRVLLPSHAEAIYYDPIAKHILTENIEGANLLFADLAKKGLPEASVLLPAPGELVDL